MLELDDGLPPIGNLRGRSLRGQDATDVVVRGGSGAGLAFEFRGTGRTGSSGRLDFLLCGERVWTVDLTPEVLTEGLLGLANAWAYLRVEDNYPRPDAAHPVAAAKPASWMGRRLTAPATRDAFRAVHDVSCWAGGFADAGRLWIVREGGLAVVEVDGRTMRRRYSEVLAALLGLGQALSADPSVGAKAVKAWTKRDDVQEERLESVSLGMSLTRLRRLAEDGVRLVSGRRELFEGLGAVGAAARMLGRSVDDDGLREIVRKIRSTGSVRTEVLDALSEHAAEVVAGARHEVPHYQGLLLAGWLRCRLGLADDRRFDPDRFLADWGVPVHTFVTRRRIEAIAFWGGEHGPAILLNPQGKSNRGMATTNGFTGGARATLSHEICHLLVDRTGSLPVADVLGGRVADVVEERANSFAAELLLPQAAAGRAFQNAPDVTAAVMHLTRTYGVSRTVAAWQILKRFRTTPNVLSVEDVAYLHSRTDRLPERGRDDGVSEGLTDDGAASGT